MRKASYRRKLKRKILGDIFSGGAVLLDEVLANISSIDTQTRNAYFRNGHYNVGRVYAHNVVIDSSMFNGNITGTGILHLIDSEVTGDTVSETILIEDSKFNGIHYVPKNKISIEDRVVEFDKRPYSAQLIADINNENAIVLCGVVKAHSIDAGGMNLYFLDGEFQIDKISAAGVYIESAQLMGIGMREGKPKRTRIIAFDSTNLAGNSRLYGDVISPEFNREPGSYFEGAHVIPDVIICLMQDSLLQDSQSKE